MDQSSMQPNDKNIDIIIVNYNSTDYSIKCSESIYATSNGLKPNLIVVDNCSKDRPERIISKFPKVQLVKNSKNEGFSKAVNLALTKCSAPLVMLLNPDTIVVDGLFEDVIDFMVKNPDVAITGPKILNEDGTIQGSARSFPTMLTSIFGRKSPLTLLFPNNSITRKNILTEKSDGKNPLPVDWVSGACMILRREVLERIGTLDEKFFMYWEDADICRRAKDSGFNVVYYPKPKVYHLVGKSSDTNPIFSIFHFHRSCYYLFKKYSTWPVFLMVAISIMGLALRCTVVILLNVISRLIQTKKNQTKNIKHDKKREIKKKTASMVVSKQRISPELRVLFLSEQMNHQNDSSRPEKGTLSNQSEKNSRLSGNKKQLRSKILERQ